MPTNTDRKLRVFLCHSSQDKPIVRELYQRLNAEGWIDPWLDEEKLLPGQDWDMEIERAVRTTDAVLVCLSSNSVDKEGYIQHEIRLVLRIAGYKPDGVIFIIPIRLNDCAIPMRLELQHYVDYFLPERKEWAYKRLVLSLQTRLQQIVNKEIAEQAKPIAEQNAHKELEVKEIARMQKEERERQEKASQEAKGDTQLKKESNSSNELQYTAMQMAWKAAIERSKGRTNNIKSKESAGWENLSNKTLAKSLPKKTNNEAEVIGQINTSNSTQNTENLLPSNLQIKLNTVIESLPSFWEKKYLSHFFIQGLAHSKRLQRKLAELELEIPGKNRLSSVEKYVLLASSYLFEIGMQSRDLTTPPLNFSTDSVKSLTFAQLEEIRANKHLLSRKMIMEHVKPQHKKEPYLGLADDEFTPIIANICGFCSDQISIEEISEVSSLPGGLLVRNQLLVALLRLADQLYIDPLRIDFQLLEEAWMSKAIIDEDYVRWRLYHYTQTLPLYKGRIRLHYFMPVEQKEYAGHIRGVLEPQFEYEKNPILKYLQREFDIRLFLDNPAVRFDVPNGFQNLMSADVLKYLRQEVIPLEISKK